MVVPESINQTGHPGIVNLHNRPEDVNDVATGGQQTTGTRQGTPTVLE